VNQTPVNGNPTPLLLLVLPPLRRRLLAPFRDDLVAQARLEDSARLGYFADSRARVNGGEPIRLSQLRSGLSGVAVLQADSGLAVHVRYLSRLLRVDGLAVGNGCQLREDDYREGGLR